MGIVRGTRTLLRLNQVGGVDCPGCAWPEPDAKRSHFEFCENGAKHLADEATTKTQSRPSFSVSGVLRIFPRNQTTGWVNRDELHSQ